MEEKLEKEVLPLTERIEMFKKLVDMLGTGRVIWRFNLLILTNEIGVPDLLPNIKNIGNQFYGYTAKLMFSFADISFYKKVKFNLENNLIRYKEVDETSMSDFTQGLSTLNQKWRYTLPTYKEKINLEKYRIEQNHCVDDKLIAKNFNQDSTQMEYLGIKVIPADLSPEPMLTFTRNYKDRGQ